MRKRNKNFLIVISLIIIALFGFNYLSVYQEKELKFNIATSRTDVVNTCGINWKNAQTSDEHTHTEDWKYIISKGYDIQIGVNKIIFNTDYLTNARCLPFGSPNSRTNIEAPIINLNGQDYKTAFPATQSNYYYCLGRYSDNNAPETRAYLKQTYGNLLTNSDSELSLKDGQIIIFANPVDRDGFIGSGSYSPEGCLSIYLKIKLNSEVTSKNFKKSINKGENYVFKSDLGSFGFSQANSIVTYKLADGKSITIKNNHTISNNEISVPIDTKTSGEVGISVTPYVKFDRENYLFENDTYYYENPNSLITSFDIIEPLTEGTNEEDTNVVVETPNNTQWYIIGGIIVIISIILFIIYKIRRK